MVPAKPPAEGGQLVPPRATCCCQPYEPQPKTGYSCGKRHQRQGPHEAIPHIPMGTQRAKVNPVNVGTKPVPETLASCGLLKNLAGAGRHVQLGSQCIAEIDAVKRAKRIEFLSDRPLVIDERAGDVYSWRPLEDA